MLTIFLSVLLAAAPNTVETAVQADTVDYIFYVDENRVDPETAKAIKLADIKTITTVKGEAAFELYGVEAPNGVIDIKTKKGATKSNQEKGTHEYVDLGLSVKWATCNVGAEVPENYGDYFSWGEIEPKPAYTWANYRFYKSGTTKYNVKFSKYSYSINYGVIDKKPILDPRDDVAHVKWGGNWRMPTKEEMDELRTKCSWTWVIINGVPGFKVTSKKTGYKDRSIFLPAAGCRGTTYDTNIGYTGYYWTSSLRTGTSDRAYILYFYANHMVWDDSYRYMGMPVRPVCQ